MNKHAQCKMYLALFMAVFLFAVANGISATNDLKNTHDEVDTMQWAIISALFGLVQILLGYIYISGIKSIKESIQAMDSRINHIDCIKLDKEMHDKICKVQR